MTAAPTPALLDRPAPATGERKAGVRYIDGVEVIADEPTPTGIKESGGGTVVQQQTRTLLLADGRELYGCAHCDYTSPNRLSIRPHLRTHATPERRAEWKTRAGTPAAAATAEKAAATRRERTAAEALANIAAHESRAAAAEPATEKEPAVPVPAPPAPAAPTVRIVRDTDKQAPPGRAGVPADLADLTLREIAVRLADSEQRDETAQRAIADWRRRAVAAEKQVEQIRQALSAAGLRLDVG